MVKQGACLNGAVHKLAEALARLPPSAVEEHDDTEHYGAGNNTDESLSDDADFFEAAEVAPESISQQQDEADGNDGALAAPKGDEGQQLHQEQEGKEAICSQDESEDCPRLNEHCYGINRRPFLRAAAPRVEFWDRLR